MDDFVDEMIELEVIENFMTPTPSYGRRNLVNTNSLLEEVVEMEILDDIFDGDF